MSPGSSTESYPAFACIGLRENLGKNLNQVTCPDRDSNPGYLVSRPDTLTVTPQNRHYNITVHAFCQDTHGNNVSVEGVGVEGKDGRVSTEFKAKANPFPYNSTNLCNVFVQTRYNWDEKQQGLILGGFFWLFWATQVPGGILAQRYGPKMVYGLTTSFLMVFCLLIPLASSLDYRVVVFLRVLQGFSAGASMPSIHRLTANWIPPNERSKFVTAYMGTSVGAAVTYPFCGLLISWFGWPSVFYITGAIGVIWFTAWWLLAYDSPAQHPRISKEEKLNIMNKIGDVIAPKTMRQLSPSPRPPRSTLSLNALYLFQAFNPVEEDLTFKTCLDKYFRRVGLSLGILYHYDASSDLLQTYSWLGYTDGCIGQGLFMLALAFSGCNSTAAIVFSIGATGMSGTVSSGALASFIDMSPNFAGASARFRAQKSLSALQRKGKSQKSEVVYAAWSSYIQGWPALIQ
ncbi:hypothetical protein ANN_14563 [Periplaneta americana]|uniref:Major facilitator superfamily (MFS) profile domain-containing protein n=1 Tax=Periplaneta americana TaxID=6978 RepID=A0ABQ8SY09_PERAM|nr:hypothetical protein ANN_14563 [Periplaneta americana]